VQSILAKAVYSNDIFKVAFHLEPEFEHVPCLSGERGEITHFWALVKFKDGGHHFDFMTRQEVDKVRDEHSAGYKLALSKGGWALQETPWVKHYEAMGLKTVIRRIAKYLPMSVQKLSTIDSVRENGGRIEIDAFGEIAAIEHEEAQETSAIETRSRLDVFDAETGEVLPEATKPSPPKTQAKPPVAEAKPAESARANPWESWNGNEWEEWVTMTIDSINSQQDAQDLSSVWFRVAAQIAFLKTQPHMADKFKAVTAAYDGKEKELS
jgi:recombination protein RecT